MDVSAAEQPTGAPHRDDTLIQQVIANWDQGWRTFDADVATRDYADDADWTNAFGTSRKGKAEIYTYLAALFQTPQIRARRSTSSTAQIRLVRPDVAGVSSYRETVGQQTASGAEYPTRKTYDLRIIVHDSGQWSIHSHLIMDEKETRP